jgi:hypothetical protein
MENVLQGIYLRYRKKIEDKCGSDDSSLVGLKDNGDLDFSLLMLSGSRVYSVCYPVCKSQR